MLTKESQSAVPMVGTTHVLTMRVICREVTAKRNIAGEWITDLDLVLAGKPVWETP
jgi:hypothetical protein